MHPGLIARSLICESYEELVRTALKYLGASEFIVPEHNPSVAMAATR
jgi:hypothetical protein